jgi:hypothetical protein
MTQPDSETPDRRASLAAKARLLYARGCTPLDEGGCLEGFAHYHLERGELAVVTDLLEFLDGQVALLRSHGPAGRLAATEALVTRIREALRAEP